MNLFYIHIWYSLANNWISLRVCACLFHEILLAVSTLHGSFNVKLMKPQNFYYMYRIMLKSKSICIFVDLNGELNKKTKNQTDGTRENIIFIIFLECKKLLNHVWYNYFDCKSSTLLYGWATWAIMGSFKSLKNFNVPVYLS